MRLLVPALGTRIRLSAPWTFALHREGRNRDLFPLAGWDRDNVDTANSIRSEYRGNTYPNGYGKPPVRNPPITRTVYDFGEPVIDGTQEATIYPDTGNGNWRWENRKTVPCRVDGNEVVLLDPLPADTERVCVSARVRGGQSADVTLPAGTVLTLDRYYIKHGANDFDSITFRLPKPKGRRKPGDPVPPSGRFWCKLRDANRIEFEYLPEDQPWWFGLADRLRAGETVTVTHDVPKVPKTVTIAPLTLRTVADLPEQKWLVYQEGTRVMFWLVNAAETWRDLARIPGDAFGTGSQLRSSTLPVGKVVGCVTSIGGM